MAEALGADQVVLVTDADGIMSGDPKIIANPQRLKEIDVNTLVGLADSGAKFIHSKALKYKPKNIDVKVISNAHGDLSREGTLITGGISLGTGRRNSSSNPSRGNNCDWKRHISKPASHHGNG